MRATAILLAMAVTAGLVPAAQCVVRCAEPLNSPPCHRSSGKQAPKPRGNCDSIMLAGESAALRPADAGTDTGNTAILPDAAAPVTPSAAPLELALFHRQPLTPRNARHLVLRL